MLYYFSIVVIKLTDLLLYLAQAETLIVVYLGLHNLTRNIPDSGYLWLNFVRIELHKNSLKIAVRSTLVWKNCRC